MIIEKSNILRLITDTDIFIISTNKGEIVNNIIRERYSASQVEAIVNNYLSDTTNEKYLKEFNDMQEWRKQAKSIAKKVNDFIQENDLINKLDAVYEIKD
jgi:hypothetical protein